MEEERRNFAISENLAQILSHLNLSDLHGCSLVCKEWNAASKLVQNRRRLPIFQELQFVRTKSTAEKHLKKDCTYSSDSDDGEDDENFDENEETIYLEHLLNRLQFKPKISLLFHDDTIYRDDQRFNSQYIILRYQCVIASRDRKLFALSARPCINYTQYYVSNNEIAGIFFPQNASWASIQSEGKSSHLESNKKSLLKVLASATPNECVFLFFNFEWRETNFDWMSVLKEIGQEIWNKNITCWGGSMYSSDSYDQIYPHEILLIKFCTKNMLSRTLMLQNDISKEDFLNELTTFKNSVKHELKSVNTLYFLTYLEKGYLHTETEEKNNMDYIRMIRQTFSNSNVFSLFQEREDEHNISFGFDYRSQDCTNFLNEKMLNLLLISYDND